MYMIQKVFFILLETGFENFFQGCFSVYIKMIVGYLTVANGKQAQRKHIDNRLYYFIGKFEQALALYLICNTVCIGLQWIFLSLFHRTIAKMKFSTSFFFRKKEISTYSPGTQLILHIVNTSGNLYQISPLFLYRRSQNNTVIGSIHRL